MLPGDSPVGAGGTGAGKTLKFTGLELPPPGDGLLTTTGKLPAAPRSDAVSAMFNWPLLTKEAECRMPLNLNSEVRGPFESA